MSASSASLTSPGSSSALDEETARAELYGLLSQLYYAAPSAELMAALRVRQLSVMQRPLLLRAWIDAALSRSLLSQPSPFFVDHRAVR